MTERDGAAASVSTFADKLREQADRLNELRVQRGDPSLRMIEARAKKLFGETVSLPISTQSTAFGAKFVSLDKLMLLVRTLLSWDEYGDECAPPDRRSAALEEWRVQWRAIAGLRPRRRRAPVAATPGAAGRPETPVEDPPQAPIEREPEREPQSSFHDAVASPEGSPLVDKGDDTVQRHERKHPHSVTSSDGLAARAVLYAVHQGQQMMLPELFLDHSVHAVAFSPDGSLLATAGDKRTLLWDVVTQQPVGALSTDDFPGVGAVAFSPDGSLLATAGYSRTLLWDLATQQPIGEPLPGHFPHDGTVAFSPDGSLLATAGDEHALLWDVVTQQPVGALSTDDFPGVGAVAFSPDGSLLVTAGEDGAVRLWDPTTRQPTGEPLKGHQGEVLAVAFSPDGSLLVTAGEDGAVRLWDPTTRQPTGEPLKRHECKKVRAVAFSPDGSLLVTAGEDGAVRLWDPTTRQSTGELDGPFVSRVEKIYAVAFSPDGSLLATASNDGGDGAVRLWTTVHSPQPAPEDPFAAYVSPTGHTPGSLADAEAQAAMEAAGWTGEPSHGGARQRRPGDNDEL
ncbi:WD40 repeat domain-containing protein [Streptomyces flaveolus]|uniref:WD40 repeat domain-containing protein n=1 Tax=Streptomyces flaveolus TaxID=67297 RepID=UPI0038089AD2